ncbi:DMT family transporter [Rhodopila sp.]|uniref:DMT family transporter n=1 Tax=Rhodopila sp. TaxID=2480087 RepID=UPI003D0B509D
MRSIWNSAWSLLALANLFWAGNIVLARGLAGRVPPVTLAYLRWTGAFLVAIGFAWPLLRRDLPVILRHWKMMLLLSATGIASYNTMSYIGLTSTSALNALLLQSATPLVIIVWAYLLFREVPSLRQAAGVLLSLCGVAAIAAHGSLQVLAHLQLNRGDLWVIGGLAIYGIYCVMLRRRPKVHPLSFLVAAMGIGSCMMLPFMLMELAAGATIHGGATSWLGIAYTAVMPSLVAYLLFNRGVELIGAGPAGQSMHLMPLFGSILAVIFLHENLQRFHLLGIAMIAAGILLASFRREQSSVQRNVIAPTRSSS